MNTSLGWLADLVRRARADRRAFESRRAWAARGVTIAPQALVHQDTGTSLEIGEGTLVAPYSQLHLQNDARRPGAAPARLIVGRRVAINEFCNIRASGGEIVLGDDCLIAQFVSIVASNHGTSPTQPMREQAWDTRRRDVRIGSDVWIGAHAVILPGVTIGDGSIIGAGAVVTRDVPGLSVATGVPARVTGRR